MKAKLQTALKANVDPFFFALTCAMLLSVSFTAKTLTDDVLGSMSGSNEITMMNADGDFVWGSN